MGVKLQLQIEGVQYEQFLDDYHNTDKFGDQRLGQAFYDHFSLHQMSDQDRLGKLYEMDGDEAKAQIALVFEFN